MPIFIGNQMKTIERINEKQLKNVPDLAPGDTVKVYAKIVEGNKERIQIFEGVVLRIKGSGIGATFTVRKISYGTGVERTFLLHSPKLTKIQIAKRAKVRRAYLTYLRELRGKSAKLHDKQFDSLAVNIKEEELKPEELAPPTTESDNLDKEITEMTEEASDIKEGETNIEEVAEAELAEDKQTMNEIDKDETLAPSAEIAEGLEKAEIDLEKAETHEGEQSEKKSEEKI